ncbi:MAG: hypothetical protein HYT41_02700 [Candidatus Sungbacteria bacterium]|nr:hypothetical protein [Candidatus Sungbacteria bacterium]
MIDYQEVQRTIRRISNLDVKITETGGVILCRTFTEGPYYRQTSIGFTAQQVETASPEFLLKKFDEAFSVR